ncbi:MAG: hypothetical protein SFT92_09650 [Rickettsiales bacterium]|nr:hypothetical protein [Rickettsiales bacterium]
MKYLVTSIAFLTLLGSCRPMWTWPVDVPGPPEYSLGWEDGCDTGLAAEGGWQYKMAYGFKKRPEMAASDLYKQGWNEGFSFCRFSYGASRQPGNWEDIGLGSGF